jgi:hypothetical protein
MKRFTFIIVLLLLVVIADAVYAYGDCRKKSAEIQQLIFAGQFEEAEPLVRRCLDKLPEDLSFLSKLDIVLNGQGKYSASEQVHDQILEIWNQKHAAKWRAKGSPVREATWARIVTHSRDYYVIGTEYYTPEVLGEAPAQILVFYKVIALPMADENEARLFKLEMSEIETKYYVLRESLGNGGRQVIPYGDQKPDLRQVVTDSVSYLDRKGY